MGKLEYRIMLMDRKSNLEKMYGNPENPEARKELKFINKKLKELEK